jgi:diguanylate cyclase (GGDEF)-like protein
MDLGKLGRLAPPKGLLARIRWLFLLFACFVTLGVVAQVAISRMALGLRAVALGLLVWLLWWWVRGYRTGRFPAGGEVVELVTLLVAPLAVGDPYRAFGLLYGAVIFRALYGSRRRALTYIAAGLGAVLGAVLLAPLLGSRSNLVAVFQQLPGVPIIGVFSHLIATTSSRQERAAARERVLSRTGTALAVAGDRAAIYRRSVEAACELLDDLGGAWAGIGVADAAGGETVVAAAGSPPAEVAVGRRFDGGMLPPKIRQALHQGRTVYADPGSAGEISFSTAGGSVILLPLRTTGGLLGTLVAAVDRQMPAEAKDSLEMLAAQVSLGLANVVLQEDLRHRAFYDALTGLANRALLLDRLDQAIVRARREHHRLAVLLLDLDDFKQVNDTFGHAAGDRLLAVVAERLRGCARASDTPARLGGDEFALLLDGLAAPEDAATVAERLTAAIEVPFQADGAELAPRASVGIAVWSGREDVDELLRQADAAMYAAKRRAKRVSAG